MLGEINRYFRIRDWIHILGVSTLGFVYSGSDLLSFEFVSLLILSSLGLAFGYSLDTNYDKYRNNKVKHLLPSIMTGITGIIYSSIFSMTTLLIFISAALIMITYVLPPFRFKGIPILVTLSNAAGFALLFLLGFSISSGLNVNVVLLSVFVAIVSFPVQLVHEISHIEKDRKMKLNTTSIKFGLKITYILIYTLLVILMLLSLTIYKFLNISFLFPISSIAFSAVFYLILKFVKNREKSRILIRYLNILFGTMLLIIFSRFI